jgi:hypothetical protein
VEFRLGRNMSEANHAELAATVAAIRHERAHEQCRPYRLGTHIASSVLSRNRLNSSADASQSPSNRVSCAVSTGGRRTARVVGLARARERTYNPTVSPAFCAAASICAGCSSVARKPRIGALFLFSLPLCFFLNAMSCYSRVGGRADAETSESTEGMMRLALPLQPTRLLRRSGCARTEKLRRLLPNFVAVKPHINCHQYTTSPNAGTAACQARGYEGQQKRGYCTRSLKRSLMGRDFAMDSFA